MNSLTNIIKQSLKTPVWTRAISNKIVRYSSFKSSPFVCDLEPTVKYETTRDPIEWAAVERLLPPVTIPKPPLKDSYISGWKPQTVEALKHPYFIKRSRNHMVPVYMITTHRGQRRLTRIRNIEGDIWQLEKDIKAFLQPLGKKPIRMQVHEYAGFILVHGDHVNAIKHWLLEKQF